MSQKCNTFYPRDFCVVPQKLVAKAQGFFQVRACYTPIPGFFGIKVKCCFGSK
jgi:hypothetical protein